MPNAQDDFADALSAEADRRKLQKLVDEGVIPELHEIPIYHMICPNNSLHPLDGEGSYCPQCRVKSVEEEL